MSTKTHTSPALTIVENPETFILEFKLEALHDLVRSFLVSLPPGSVPLRAATDFLSALQEQVAVAAEAAYYDGVADGEQTAEEAAEAEIGKLESRIQELEATVALTGGA